MEPIPYTHEYKGQGVKVYRINRFGFKEIQTTYYGNHVDMIKHGWKLLNPERKRKAA